MTQVAPWFGAKKAGDKIPCLKCGGKGWVAGGLSRDYPQECSKCVTFLGCSFPAGECIQRASLRRAGLSWIAGEAVERHRAQVLTEALEWIEHFSPGHHSDQPTHVLLHALTIDIPSAARDALDATSTTSAERSPSPALPDSDEIVPVLLEVLDEDEALSAFQVLIAAGYRIVPTAALEALGGERGGLQPMPTTRGCGGCESCEREADLGGRQEPSVVDKWTRDLPLGRRTPSDWTVDALRDCLNKKSWRAAEGWARQLISEIVSPASTTRPEAAPVPAPCPSCVRLESQLEAVRGEAAEHRNARELYYDQAVAAQGRVSELEQVIGTAEAALANEGWMSSGEQDRRDYVAEPLRAALAGRVEEQSSSESRTPPESAVVEALRLARAAILQSCCDIEICPEYDPRDDENV